MANFPKKKKKWYGGNPAAEAHKKAVKPNPKPAPAKLRN